MAPTNSASKKKRPLWKYAFYVSLVILGSIVGVVSYVTYTKGSLDTYFILYETYYRKHWLANDNSLSGQPRYDDVKFTTGSLKKVEKTTSINVHEITLKTTSTRDTYSPSKQVFVSRLFFRQYIKFDYHFYHFY